MGISTALLSSPSLLQQVCRDYTGLANDGYCNSKGYYPTSKFTRSTRPSGYQTTGSTARSHSDEKMTGEGILPSPRSELNILAPPLLA